MAEGEGLGAHTSSSCALKDCGTLFFGASISKLDHGVQNGVLDGSLPAHSLGGQRQSPGVRLSLLGVGLSEWSLSYVNVALTRPPLLKPLGLLNQQQRGGEVIWI